MSRLVRRARRTSSTRGGARYFNETKTHLITLTHGLLPPGRHWRRATPQASQPQPSISSSAHRLRVATLAKVFGALDLAHLHPSKSWVRAKAKGDAEVLARRCVNMPKTL